VIDRHVYAVSLDLIARIHPLKFKAFSNLANTLVIPAFIVGIAQQAWCSGTVSAARLKPMPSGKRFPVSMEGFW